ncbi:hypothetical protein CC79DRAFT_1338068 [Sarocladium strictum]
MDVLLLITAASGHARIGCVLAFCMQNAAVDILSRYGKLSLPALRSSVSKRQGYRVSGHASVHECMQHTLTRVFAGILLILKSVNAHPTLEKTYWHKIC